MCVVYDQCFIYRDGKKVRDLLYLDEKDGESINNVLRKYLRWRVGVHVVLVFSDETPYECQDLFSELEELQDCAYISMGEQIIEFEEYGIGCDARGILRNLIDRIRQLELSIEINEELYSLIDLTQANKRVYRDRFAKRWNADICEEINKCLVCSKEACIYILLVLRERYFEEICSAEDYVLPRVVEAVVHCTTKEDRRARAERAFRAYYEQINGGDRAKMKNAYLQTNNLSQIASNDTITVEMDTGLRRSRKMIY